ncbi:hypothetical protein ACHAWF_015843 [Thalassiosira exigua]
MCKSDIEKAYRRLHVTPEISAKCLTAWTTREKDEEGNISEEFIGSILTRLPFGSSPAPPEFWICLETIFNLANDLLHCPHWEPSTLPSPYTAEIPPPERLPDKIPFGRAEPNAVHLPPSQHAGTEGYIDDGTLVVLDTAKTKAMVKRAWEALPMANHLVFRPLNNEPIPRPDAQSIRKLLAEGHLREILIFLGWQIDSRRFEISLPRDKARAWTASLLDVLKSFSASWDTIKTLVGRLNHIGLIIPSVRHFLNRIRRLEKVAEKHDRAMMTRETREDMLL